MDYKKTKAPLTTVTRNLNDLDGGTGNIYETVMVAAKRANQISVEMKQELNRKLEEISPHDVCDPPSVRGVNHIPCVSCAQERSPSHLSSFLDP